MEQSQGKSRARASDTNPAEEIQSQINQLLEGDAPLSKQSATLLRDYATELRILEAHGEKGLAAARASKALRDSPTTETFLSIAHHLVACPQAADPDPIIEIGIIDEDPASCALILGQLKDPRATEMLLDFLASDRSDGWLSLAIASVKRSININGPDSAICFLEDCLEQDEYQENLPHLMSALAEEGNKESIAAILDCLDTSKSPKFFYAALSVLKSVDLAAVSKRVSEAAESSEEFVFQQAAMHCLLNHSNEAAVKLLTTHYLMHPEHDCLAAETASALKNFDKPEVSRALILHGLSHSNSSTRMYSAEALGQFQNAAVVDQLIELGLDSRTKEIQEQCRVILERRGDQMSKPLKQPSTESLLKTLKSWFS